MAKSQPPAAQNKKTKKTMRKNYILLRTWIVLVVMSATAVMTANAQNVGDTFTSGVLKYEITSLSPKKVKVIKNDPKPTGDITIPETVSYSGADYSVTAIGEDAFESCHALTSLAIPNSVTTIGWRAFNGCDNLTSVTIPNSVTTIGANAFNNCTALTSFEVATDNSSYSSVNGVLFNKDKSTLIQCPARKTGDYTIPNSVTTIGEAAFENCTALTSVTIGDKVTTIEKWAFSFCESLTSVIIPNSVTKIRGYAFNDCHALTSLTIPKSVTTIEEDAFDDCNALTAIEVDIDNTVYSSVNGVLFNKDKKTLIKCPGGKEEYTIPNSVTTIGEAAFENCEKLKSVTIGEKVTTIEDYAFQYCEKLTSITSLLQNVNNVTMGSYVFNYFPTNNCTLYVPTGKVAEYQNADHWKEFGLITDDNTLGVKFKQGQLYYLTIASDKVKLVSQNPYHPYWDNSEKPTGEITIPSTVTYNGKSYQVTEINNNVFENCSNLTSVTIGENVTTIGEEAFSYCNALTSLTIGENVRTIGKLAFYQCYGLTSLTIGEKVTTIGDMAFYQCKGLTSVTIPNSVATIKYGAFADCPNLSSVSIPNSVTSIGGAVFWNCTSLTSINVNDDNTAYSSVNGVLFNKDKTTLVQYPKGKADTDYTIPNSVTTIGADALSRCTGLTSVTIPNSVTSIGDWAFTDCFNLSSLTSLIEDISSSHLTMGKNVFNGVPTSTCTLKVPIGKKGEYEVAEQWKKFTTIQNISTGIRNATVLTNPITVIGNNITISEVAGKNVKLYSITGQMLYNLHATQDNITLSVKQSGAYIVQVENGTRKVVVK